MHALVECKYDAGGPSTCAYDCKTKEKSKQDTCGDVTLRTPAGVLLNTCCCCEVGMALCKQYTSSRVFRAKTSGWLTSASYEPAISSQPMCAYSMCSACMHACIHTYLHTRVCVSR